jgi:hypothetical protein
MNSGKTIFAQVLDFVPTYEFRKCVERYNGHYKVIRFSCWDQYLAINEIPKSIYPLLKSNGRAITTAMRC